MPQKIRSQIKISIRALLSAAAVVLLSLTMVGTVRPRARPVIQDRFSSVDNVKLHYLVAGRGEPVILLHGYTQYSHMWRPLMVELAKSRLAIAPDLRGFGQSSKPANGYQKKIMPEAIIASRAASMSETIRKVLWAP
jgi:alpha-beta hydrolase superfamily lysophospholipase